MVEPEFKRVFYIPLSKASADHVFVEPWSEENCEIELPDLIKLKDMSTTPS